MPVAELAVVTVGGRVYGLFLRPDAERIARWLRNGGARAVRVTVAAIEPWGPLPHRAAQRVEVRNRIYGGQAPFHFVYTLNHSLVGGPKWERREDGRLAESLSWAQLQQQTEQWLVDGYRVAQYPADL